MGGSSSSATANSASTMGFGGNVSGMSDKQASERLAQLGSRKAISSADFQHDDSKSAEMQQRFAAISGATQISSDMFFGGPGGAPPSNAA